MRILKEGFFNNELEFISLGQILFFIGVFFLPSALILGGSILLISLSISLYVNKNLFFKDKWNWSLTTVSFLLILSCIYNQSLSINLEISNWVSLLNWIPLFLAFFGFQFYLNTQKKRYLFVIIILMGSFPIFFSCLTQSWLKWYGPYETLFGLIVWFQKPPESDAVRGISGLFSNENYTGLWLSMLFPFSIALTLKKGISLIKRLAPFLTTILIVYLVVLTNSRNAVLGLTLSIPILFTLKGIFISMIFLLLLYLLNLFILNPIIPSEFKELIPKFYPDKLFTKFIETLDSSSRRIDIWKKVIAKISSAPWLGWGAGSLMLIYVWIDKGIEFEFNVSHSHNLPLELAHNYGIPVAFILCFTIALLYFKSAKIILNRSRNNFEELLDKAWLAAATIILVSHLSDITYYDGRVSLAIWILLAGLKTIIDKESIKIKEN